MASDVTRLLVRWSSGDQEALAGLLPLVYDQLKQLARDRMRRERNGHTLDTTGLVHEAFLRLVDVKQIQWKNRAHFLALASQTMRRVLVDHARARKTQKRGGGRKAEELRDDMLMTDLQAESLLDLDNALQRLSSRHPRASCSLELRYFGGLTLAEVAEVLDVSAPTVMRDVRFAEAWLARNIERGID